MKLVAVLFAMASVPLHAEFLWVEMQFGGMDCASCSTFIQEKLAKNRNVQSVDIDAAKGLPKVTLKPATRMRPEQVRDLVQQSGYTTSQIRAGVRGTAAEQSGKWTLTVPEPSQSYPITATGPVIETLKQSAGKPLELNGLVAGDELQVKSARKTP